MWLRNSRRSATRGAATVNVIDFNGNGANPGYAFLFVGYGAGATFTNDATHWQVNYDLAWISSTRSSRSAIPH
jgi:hypothetical protein